MDFDRLAQQWAHAEDVPAHQILSTLMAYDSDQLMGLRNSVARHPSLGFAIELIDGFSAFREARRRLDEARLAAASVATHARSLVEASAGAPELARESATRAVHAQEAANAALQRANSPRERVDAAVVVELADRAAAQAHHAVEAADRMASALDALVRATQNPRLDGTGK